MKPRRFNYWCLVAAPGVKSCGNQLASLRVCALYRALFLPISRVASDTRCGSFSLPFFLDSVVMPTSPHFRDLVEGKRRLSGTSGFLSHARFIISVAENQLRMRRRAYVPYVQMYVYINAAIILTNTRFARGWFNCEPREFRTRIHIHLSHSRGNPYHFINKKGIVFRKIGQMQMNRARVIFIERLFFLLCQCFSDTRVMMSKSYRLHQNTNVFINFFADLGRQFFRVEIRMISFKSLSLRTFLIFNTL